MSNKPDRNSPCPCGSGKKYKQCCFFTDRAAPAAPGAAPQTVSHASVFTSGPGARLPQSQQLRMDPCAQFFISNDPEVFASLPDSEMKEFLTAANAGKYFYEANRPQDYKKAMLKCLEIVPLSREIHYNLAYANYMLLDLDSCLEVCDRLIAECPKVMPIDFASRASYRYIRGDDAGADADIAEVMRRKPETPGDINFICSFWALERRHAEIRALCEQSPFRSEPEVTYFLGVALANLGETEAAKKTLRLVAGRQTRHKSLAVDYLRMLEAGETPRTIFNDWRYLYQNEMCPPELFLAELIKSGFEFGKRIPSFHDRRLSIAVNEYLVEAADETNYHEAVEQIGFSKLPRAKETLLAIAKNPKIGSYRTRIYAGMNLYRFKKLKRGEHIQCDLSGTGAEVDKYKMWYEFSPRLFWVAMRGQQRSIVQQIKNMIKDRQNTRQLYKDYGHYAKPATKV